MSCYAIKFDNGAYNLEGGFEARLGEATLYENFDGAAREAEELVGVAGIVNVGVHQTHCCDLHGCKYGDEDCPVAGKEIKQLYDCETCSEMPWHRHEIAFEAYVRTFLGTDRSGWTVHMYSDAVDGLKALYDRYQETK
jgi:hypothetical protein